MSHRKFCVLMCALSLVFFAILGSGCGGGGGGGDDSTQSLVDPNAPANSQDVPVPAPAPTSPDTPAPAPDTPATPAPAPTPESPDIPAPVSPDVPAPTPESPDIPAPAPAPASPDTTPEASYTVTFNSNGGSQTASITVNAGSTLEQPADPAKSGYIFAGWYRDTAFTEPFMFGPNGDTVSSSTTLYAQWIDDDPAGFTVDYALAGLTITYAECDNPDYVTQNLGLPANSEGLSVNWSSSNPGVISETGNVTRPSSSTRVTLTAKIVSGDFEAERSFALTVIKARTLTHEQAKLQVASVDMAEIEIMNQSNDHFEVAYDADDVVRAIEGKFTDVKVETADDALDAVHSVHEMLGIADPYEEAQPFNVAKDEYGAQYAFRQIHRMSDLSMGTVGTEEKVPVYGRTLVVSANSDGETDFLTSNFLPTNKLAGLSSQYTPDLAENAALRSYTGSDVSVVSADTQKIVYSLDDYEQRPVMAFMVTVTGRNTSGDAVDDTVIVSAVDLSILRVTENIRTWMLNDYGPDELGNRQTFPTAVTVFPIRKNLRDNASPEVRIYSADINHPVRINLSERWTDGHQISAYTNMRTVIKWWRDTFNRNSLDNKGMTVKLITHDTSMNDNACWSPGQEYICVGNIGDASKYNLTRAIGLDTLTHETAHAVMKYSTGGIPYQNATGAIDDGYADIFGCLRDQDWRHGWRADNNSSGQNGITYFIDKTQCLRDARENVTVNSISQTDMNDGTLNTIDDLYKMYVEVAPKRSNDNNGCHFYCRLVTHAAYLMHQDSAGSNGLTWGELGRVWYKSFTMGLDATSNFHTVRRNVLRAAEQLRLSNTKLRTIRRAFDAIGVYSSRGVIKGRVRDYMSGGSLEQGGASVVLRGSAGLVETSGIVSPDGTFSFTVDTGNYTVQVAPTWGSYRPYQTRASVVSEGDVVSIRAELVKTGTGSLDVRVSNASAVSDVTIRLSNNVSGASYSGTSGADGRYVFTNLPSGYYTLRLSKEGYDNMEIETAVPPSRTTTKTLPMAVTFNNYQYKAYLFFGNRDYLDPHLKGRLGSTLSFRVEEGNTSAHSDGGREIARYDAMMESKFKLITFTNFADTSFKFYVKWDGVQDVDWNNSGAGVFLYYYGRLMKIYTPPHTDSKGQYWEVFSIRNGRRKNTNAILLDEPELD